MLGVEPVVTLEEAQRHLVLAGAVLTAATVADVQTKLDQAIGTVLHRINDAAVTAAYTEATVPPAVHAAILVLLEDLYVNRGAGEVDSQIMSRVDILIAMVKKPALA